LEYLLVKFADRREVVINDISQGWTNVTLELEKGSHTVRLKSPPSNFRPEKIEIELKKTTALKPMEVHFEKIS